MLNLNHLKYFVDAADLKSITRASEVNLIGPSAISQSIKQLEESLGCKLIDHRKNRFLLTVEGQALQKRGAEMLESVKAILHDIRFSDQKGVGKLLIATTHSLAQMIVFPSLKRLNQDFPNLVPKVSIGGTASIIQKVENRESDVGIAMDDGSKTHLQKKILGRGKFRIFTSRKNAKKILWQDQKIWLTNPHFEGHGFENQFYKLYGKNPDWGFQLESWTLVAKVIEDGMGVGILPDFIQKIHPQLVQIESRFDFRKYSIVSYSRREELGTNVQLMLEAIKF